MKRPAAICAFALATILTCQSQSGIKTRGTVKQKPAEKPAAALAPAEPVAAPEPPPRPAQKPPVPAQVSLSDGLITVIAENSTLTDVLNGIQKVAGVKIDSDGVVSHERVAAKIGPAPVREVLYSILQGSRYDFVILSSLKDPAIVERVVLTPKIAGSSQPASTSAQKPAQPVQVSEPVDVMDSGDGNEGFAPPGVAVPSPPPGSQPPPENKPPEQLQDEQRNNPRYPNGQPPNREPRPERPRL